MWRSIQIYHYLHSFRMNQVFSKINQPIYWLANNRAKPHWEAAPNRRLSRHSSKRWSTYHTNVQWECPATVTLAWHWLHASGWHAACQCVTKCAIGKPAWHRHHSLIQIHQSHVWPFANLIGCLYDHMMQRFWFTRKRGSHSGFSKIIKCRCGGSSCLTLLIIVSLMLVLKMSWFSSNVDGGTLLPYC